MLLFHIATRSDWEAARRDGSYTTSTLGRSLAEEGFVHAAHRHQVAGVFDAHYRGVREPLLLLTIDSDRLSSPWAEEPVGAESYPHIRGPIDLDAVRAVSPLNRRGGTESLTSLFLKEMLGRIAAALVVMAMMSAGVLLAGNGLRTEWGPLIGAGAGLLVGILAVLAWHRRRTRPGRP